MRAIIILIFILGCSSQENYNIDSKLEYKDLVNLFNEWRDFESPPLLNGAPDYTKERFEKDHNNFISLRKRLNSFNISNWSVNDQIDWHIVRAEMNGYDFNYRVLRPWERDPAYYQTLWMYQSDVPAHEGPTNHGVLEFWMYDIPLGSESEQKIINELKSITPFLNQAKINLTGNAKELWEAGIENLRQQRDNLIVVRSKLNLSSEHEINKEIKNAINSTEEFIKWLEDE